LRGNVRGLPAPARGMSWFAEHYQTLRAIHIIAVIAWMAGLMYLPRLYVYHSLAERGGEAEKTFIVMERRLLRGIMNPSLVIVWGLGLALIVSRGGWDFLGTPWLQVKLGCVVGVTILHMVYAAWRKRFERGERPLNHVVYRVINEAPFVLAIVAVLMAVLEPAFGA
jgi:protoporphyrinogen IX oxidase